MFSGAAKGIIKTLCSVPKRVSVRFSHELCRNCRSSQSESILHIYKHVLLFPDSNSRFPRLLFHFLHSSSCTFSRLLISADPTLRVLHKPTNNTFTVTYNKWEQATDSRPLKGKRWFVFFYALFNLWSCKLSPRNNPNSYIFIVCLLIIALFQSFDSNWN